MSQIDLNASVVPTGIHDVAQHEVAGHQQAVEGSRSSHVPAETREIASPAETRSQVQQAVPEMNRNLEGAAAPNREGFFSRIGHFFHNLKEALFGQGFTLPQSVTLHMPDGGEISYPPARLTDMVKALPKAQRAEFVEMIQGHMQAKINRGHNMLNAVYNGTAQAGPSTKDVADVLFFLEAKSIQAGQSFTSGAFSVEDTAGRLYQWLDSCSERYQRSSSHLGWQTDVPVDGHRNTHRGIDIAPGHDGLTCGKNTLLFGAIPADNYRTDAGRRIFLKMEGHSCRLNTLNMFHRKHLAQGRTPGAQADRPVHISDIKDSIEHGLSFLRKKGKGSAEGTRKEAIPKDVKAAFKEVLNTAKADTPLGALLRLGEPLDGGSGIRVMVYNITRAADQMDAPEQQQAVQNFFRVLSSMPDHSHLDSRIGNEVMFDRNDLI